MLAIYIGNKEDFHKYIGPRVRNKVQQITSREKRKANGTCAHCKQTRVTLEAVHVHGKSRKMIIDTLLDKFIKKNVFRGGYFRVDLDLFEKQIVEAHQPISEYFIFLCRECHFKYDSTDKENLRETKVVKEVSTLIIDTSTNENEVLRVQRRLPRWFNNTNQYNSRILYSFLELYFENNGRVTVDELRNKAGIKTFDQNFTQMRTIAPQNHGKIFELNDEYVELWEPVKEIVLNHYNRLKK